MAVHDMLMAAAGGTAGAVNYIDDVFSTWLYTGNGSTQTITNGIDLAGKGGLTWIKRRDSVGNNFLFDTVRGVGNTLFSDDTSPEVNFSASLTSFNANGFSLGSYSNTNGSTRTFASWTFREQAKFFDVVTYTGNGVAGRTVSHNLGSTPGCIIIKSINNLTDPAWVVVHRGMNWTQSLLLNQTDAAGGDYTNSTAPTSTVFSVSEHDPVNKSGNTYVAYLFAHNAGGFGTSGTDNVISCGSFTDVGSGGTNTINLGYEPQWVLVKRATGSTAYYQEWRLIDCMRGMTVDGTGKALYPNLSDSEGDSDINLRPNATGFTCSMSVNTGGSTYIYIAIRRPMKPPTTGTEVFKPVYGTSSAPAYNSGFVSDAFLGLYTAGDASYPRIGSRLTGTNWMKSSGTEAEAADGIIKWDYMNGVYSGYLDSGYVGEIFRRAPEFFDVVCYTGNSTAGQTFNHNLGVVPEMMIVKRRTTSGYDWYVYHSYLGATKNLRLNMDTAAATETNKWNDTAPTSTVFTVGGSSAVNTNGASYVNYLFATVAGVSKVGSYTGTGSTQQINCGFSGGARFVMIKRTDSTGDWYVWDSARGIVSGNDPYQLINTTNAQVTNTDYIDPYSAGFEISSTAPAAINANGGSFIFLAIA